MRSGRAVLVAGDVLEPDARLCNAKMSGRPVSFGSALGKGDDPPSTSSACPEARAQSAPVLSMKNSFGNREWLRHWTVTTTLT